MIGALPVLIPGWEVVCVQAVCDILGVSEGGAQCTLLLSHNQIPPEVYHVSLSYLSVFPILLIISFLLFSSFFPSPSLTPPTSPSYHLLASLQRYPNGTANHTTRLSQLKCLQPRQNCKTNSVLLLEKEMRMLCASCWMKMAQTRRCREELI